MGPSMSFFDILVFSNHLNAGTHKVSLYPLNPTDKLPEIDCLKVERVK
jgi:hypothetical protein